MICIVVYCTIYVELNIRNSEGRHIEPSGHSWLKVNPSQQKGDNVRLKEVDNLEPLDDDVYESASDQVGGGGVRRSGASVGRFSLTVHFLERHLGDAVLAMLADHGADGAFLLHHLVVAVP